MRCIPGKSSALKKLDVLQNFHGTLLESVLLQTKIGVLVVATCMVRWRFPVEVCPVEVPPWLWFFWAHGIRPSYLMS